MTIVLVHSPLVGPATWEPVATEVEQRGLAAVVPRIDPPHPSGRPWWEVAAAGVGAALGTTPPGGRGDGRGGVDRTDGSVVLVGHSGAGPRLPAIAGRLIEGDRPVAATLYVDAGLPRRGTTPAEDLPPDLRSHLQGLADTRGMLPPWPEWWGPGLMEALVPDPAMRSGIVDQCPAIPLALFDEPIPVPAGWPDDDVCGYLSFSYDAEAAEAEQLGWPVARMAGHHLQLVIDPSGVADALSGLLVALDVGP